LAEVALASTVDSVVGLDSVVASASIAVSDLGLASSTVDSDPAPSPSIAVSDLGLASTVDSVVGLHSVVALASIVDSDPAPSPSIAVSDLGLASTADSVVGLLSVDLVVDDKVDAG